MFGERYIVLRLSVPKMKTSLPLNAGLEARARRRGSSIAETPEEKKREVARRLFNSNPKKGIDFLLKEKLLEETPHAVARWLRETKGLKKSAIGEFLGRKTA